MAVRPTANLLVARDTQGRLQYLYVQKGKAQRGEFRHNVSDSAISHRSFTTRLDAATFVRPFVQCWSARSLGNRHFLRSGGRGVKKKAAQLDDQVTVVRAPVFTRCKSISYHVRDCSPDSIAELLEREHQVLGQGLPEQLWLVDQLGDRSGRDRGQQLDGGQRGRAADGAHCGGGRDRRLLRLLRRQLHDPAGHEADLHRHEGAAPPDAGPQEVEEP